LTIQGQVFRAAGADDSALPIEIAFLSRYDVSEQVLRVAARQARAAGVYADETLIRNGHLDEDLYYRALAVELGLPFLGGRLRLSSHTRFPESALTGVARLAPDEPGAQFVLAPAGRRVAWMLEQARAMSHGFAITTPSLLSKAVFERCSGQIARHASQHLAERRPHEAFGDGLRPRQLLFAAAASGALAFAGVLAPDATLIALMLISGVIFLGMVMLRLAAAREVIPIKPSSLPRRPDRLLPAYTIIVPLRRERRVLARLIRALDALDYPKSKLDAKLVIEADDREMIDALAATRLPAYCEVIVAPPGQPRTKPRALNVALPLARGELVVVYDAEDVPDCAQLRLAAETFARAAPEVACLQARLVIDNTDDNWLTRLFTIEYAALFDVINPALAALDFPVPLGGTSNHFRASILRDVQGWDAWNVTEDADLGMRLALAGYRVRDLPSSTLEEAPVTLPAWLKQRTRWMKGFMQVVITHSRRPVVALKALGPVRFFAATTMTLGTVATALGYPVFTGLSLLGLSNGSLLKAETPVEVAQTAIGLTLFAAGLAAMTLPAVAGVRRRGWTYLLPFVVLLPFYYVLVSLAAWRALFELASDPSGWHKTDHGLARTSRAGLLRGSEAAPGRLQPAAGSG
jgi:cellulose synthase/poly-beta-1,6-N-acetylglucosamine synthase-like glycosyltransferase